MMELQEFYGHFPQHMIRGAAQMAHEVNRGYCQSLGDHSQKPWDEAPLWQKESAYKGAIAIALRPSTGPGDSHLSWLAEKEATGWTYGPVKDEALKQHPCMVPFDQLPREQQAKDYLFVATVKAFLGIRA